MRLRFLIPFTLFTGIVLGAIFFIKWKLNVQSQSPSAKIAVKKTSELPMRDSVRDQSNSDSQLSTVYTSTNLEQTVIVPSAVSTQELAVASASEETPEEFVNNTAIHLEDLSRRDDKASLDELVQTLSQTNSEIWHAAIEAIKQRGDRSVISTLNARAEQSEDPDKQADLSNAAAFLMLPSISEVRNN